MIVRCIDLTLRSNEKSQSLSRAVEHRAVVHEAGAVEQDVDRRRPRAASASTASVESTSSLRRSPAVRPSSLPVEVGREDLRALGTKASAWRARCPAPPPSRTRSCPSDVLPWQLPFRAQTLTTHGLRRGFQRLRRGEGPKPGFVVETCPAKPGEEIRRRAQFPTQVVEVGGDAAADHERQQRRRQAEKTAGLAAGTDAGPRPVRRIIQL